MSSVPDWKTVNFGEIAEQIVDRIDNPEDTDLVDYIGLEHIDSGNLKIPTYGKATDVVSSKFVCRKGDIIFSRRRAYLRKLAISDRGALVSTDAMVIRPKAGFLKQFLVLVMQTDEFWNEVISRSAGSLSPRIKWRDLSRIHVSLPPTEVQEKISRIIFCVQDNLEKTENLVKVAEKLKKGLLEELLTKGISHKEFKKTELGEIPEGWNIKPLSAACSIKNGKSNSEDAVSDGLYDFFDRSTIVKKSDRFLFDCEAVIVPGEGQDFIPKHYHGKFDLHQRAYAICSDKPEISLKYVYYWLNHNRHLLVEYSVCSTVNSLRMGTFEKIKIPIPSPNEQNEIVRIAEKVDYQLNISAEHLSKLRLLQKKLINSFLSGDLSIPKEDIN